MLDEDFFIAHLLYLVLFPSNTPVNSSASIYDNVFVVLLVTDVRVKLRAGDVGNGPIGYVQNTILFVIFIVRFNWHPLHRHVP